MIQKWMEKNIILTQLMLDNPSVVLNTKYFYFASQSIKFYFSALTQSAWLSFK